MRLLNLLFPERRTSAVIARERLKIVLAHERASREAPDFLPVLQKELLDVIGRYVEIRSDMIRVSSALPRARLFPAAALQNEPDQQQPSARPIIGLMRRLPALCVPTPP